MTKRLSTSERIGISAVLALVAGFGTTALVIHADTRPSVDVPAVVVLDKADLTEACDGWVTACYAPLHDPNVVYVSDQVNPGPGFNYIVAHETVHFEQNRDGRPFDECEADAIAMQRTGYTGMQAYADQCDAGHTTDH